MHIDWWTLGLQTVNVLILVWLLKRFLYQPVMRAITARQRAAESLLADAQAARDAAAAGAAALKAQSDGFAAEAETRRDEMRAALAEERARLLARAQADAAAVTHEAAEAEAGVRARMADDLEEKAAALAGSMAETLLRRLPVPQATEAMFQALLDGLRGLPEEARRRLADGPLTVVTAAPLDESSRARYLPRLAAELPGMSAPQFEVDPALIAGFELHGRQMQVRNSWRADLDDMLAKLREGERGRVA
jgi:F-type H+-transporting ATPase subunit b